MNVKELLCQCRIIALSILFINQSCASAQNKESSSSVMEQRDTVQTIIGPLILDKPFASKPSVKVSKVIGWGKERKPIAPEGFKVSRFADNLDHPRWLYITRNGDIFIAESNTRSSANRITLKRGNQNFTFLEGLNRPFGMLILNDYFYVANTDGIVRFPYSEEMTQITAKGEQIVDLPAGGYNHHWTRNLLASKDGKKIYISVGSASNVGEYGMDQEIRRACILEINPDGGEEKVYADGIRNPVGMDWNPFNGELWTAVNERDQLGNDLVPDYITSVQRNGFYGWPYSYYGKLLDPRWEEEPHLDLVKKALVPDVPLNSHTASLGLTFYTHDQFPSDYKDGAFVGQHGSWNREEFAGYKVVFVPFKQGIPQVPIDFLTGFIEQGNGSNVYGRPVGVHQLQDGSLLVVDDDSGIIWKVEYVGK